MTHHLANFDIAEQKIRENIGRGFPLKKGDILFRWVPWLSDYQWGSLQRRISKCQNTQQKKHKCNGANATAIDRSWQVIQHVGIYYENNVIEIGPKGLKKISINDRENYDLVVRTGLYGNIIGEIAEKARKKWIQTIYPLTDLYKLANYQTEGYPPSDAKTKKAIIEMDKVYNGSKWGWRKFNGGQKVVCSHFVHAVLYAALIPGGTIRTATDKKFDHIFKISPSHMWTEFIQNKGLWYQANAKYICIQHKGKTIRSIDSSLLGVGLHKPPLPTKYPRRSSKVFDSIRH